MPDIAMDELTECRVTIGRMDTLLQDLRKYGFTLVTGLLTASSLVGASNGLAALPLAAGVIMFLVLALFGIDMYYQVVLSAAVGRAMNIEAWSHDPDIRLTSDVSRNATLTHSTTAVFFLYSALLLASLGMGLFGGDKVVPRLLLVTVAAAVFLVMLVYWMYVRAVTGLDTTKGRVVGVLRVDRSSTVTVIGSHFDRATRLEFDIPGSAHLTATRLPGDGLPRFRSRHRDSAKFTVPALGAGTEGVHVVTVLAGDRELGKADCVVVARDTPVAMSATGEGAVTGPS